MHSAVEWSWAARKEDNTLNDFAWRLVSEPPFQTVRPIWAVQIAERAVKLSPTKSAVWNTLERPDIAQENGRARSRPGEVRLDPDKYVAFNGFSWPWPTGGWIRRKRPGKWYDRAVLSMKVNASQDEVLNRFRAETEELLGIKGTSE